MNVPIIPIPGNTANVPRSCNGDNSAMYIGKILVVKPDAIPTINRAIISITTEFAIRQKKNKIALTTNKTEHANNDRFLQAHSFVSSTKSFFVFYELYLPRRSDRYAPPKEPIAPPIKNTDTIADHNKFKFEAVNCIPNEWRNDSKHQS